MVSDDVSELPRPAQAGFGLCFLVLLGGLIGLWPQTSHSQVMITSDRIDGSDVFRISTPTASYVFDKQAAALVQMRDQDGHDWISFRPEPAGEPSPLPLAGPVPADGDQGWFRGIPNLGSRDFGHTRRLDAISTTADPLDVPLAKATIQASHGDWHATWEFAPDHAKMTLHRAPESYWLLYEGTPGGRLGSDDVCWRADGQSASCDQPWVGDIVNSSGAAPDAEWVFFADGTLERSLFLAHPDDQLVDSYFRKGAMTVFGFGRQENSRTQRLINRLQFGRSQMPQLSRAPEVLLLGFVESRAFETVKREIDRLYRPQPNIDERGPQTVPVARDRAEPPA